MTRITLYVIIEKHSILPRHLNEPLGLGLGFGPNVYEAYVSETNINKAQGSYIEYHTVCLSNDNI